MENYIIAQIIGVIALIILILSFQKNEKTNLLKYQTWSSLLFAIQYLFLNAASGFFMNMMCLIRNIIFSRYKEKRVPLVWLILVIFVMSGLGVLSYNGLISILPTIAVVLYSCAIWQNNLKITRIVECISCILFIAYNIKVWAFAGLISTIIEMCSAIVAICKFDLKKIDKD